ncbi:hypothetical protein [Rhizobium laguerreae]|uniref:hypothetical protein n=1 Tax=Rhizobium laguerreae TaxID=1076926 RepID=UPI001C911466|nr:hypothetical protein [Rhizobium laguerreae]MBY3211486.1 hypothetical protein [Rhizobium laguerreae]
MNATNELNTLIIRNIEDLDVAAKHIAEIEDQIWKLITDEAERWLRARGWNIGPDASEIWFGRPDWVQEDGATFIGWFYFDKGPDDTNSSAPGEPHFWLSRYLGRAGGELCLWFGQDVAKGKAWRTVVRTFADELTKAGARISDAGNIFIPCSLSATAVAEGYSNNDFKEALAPITSALDLAEALSPVLQLALDKAREA